MYKIKDGRKHYTPEFKESVLKRLEPPTKDTVTSLARELGISRATIYAWLRAKNSDLGSKKSNKRLDSEDKFQIVTEIFGLTEQELDAYCHRKGLSVEVVEGWREKCINANTSNAEDSLKLEKDLKEKKQRGKDLEREIKRVEKALAEVNALLVLQKKAQEIWGNSEED